MIEDGKTGFLAIQDDTRTLADYLIRLLNDETLRLDIGQAGKDRLEREFSFGKFKRQLESLIANESESRCHPH